MIYSFYNFRTRGVGLISNKFIPKSTFIGNYFVKKELIGPTDRFIYNDWYETNPLGRYLNHNKNNNCDFILLDNTVRIISNKDINKNEEITVNYLSAVKCIEIPSEICEEYGIKDFEYINEKIEISNKLL